MQRIFTNVMRIALTAILFLSFSGVANAYPTSAEVAGTYHFKGTKAVAGDYASSYSSTYTTLPEEFDFEIQLSSRLDIISFFGLSGFTADKYFGYDEDDGKISIGGLNNGKIYASPIINNILYDSTGYTTYIECYVSADGNTITFPTIYVNNYDDDYTFAQYTNITCTKVVEGGDEASMIIKNPEVVWNGEAIEINLEVALENLEPNAAGVWTATAIATGSSAKDYTATYTAGENGAPSTVSFTIDDIQNGTYTYTISVSYAYSGETVESNNLQNINVTYGQYVKISNFIATPDYSDNVIDLVFDLTSYNIPSLADGEEYDYELVLTPVVSGSAGTQASDDITLTAEVETVSDAYQEGTAQIYDVAFEAGTYNYNAIVNVYEGEEMVATTLQPATLEIVLTQAITPSTDGINVLDVNNSNVRYFTISGVEVSNPKKGQIVIQINGNKARKIVR